MSVLFYNQKKMKEKPLILITNDDGYSSKGINELVKAAKPFGDVVIVAPMYEQSGSARSIKRRQEINVEETEINGLKCYAVDATPATCVMIAVEYLLDKKPDLLLSGINCGENISSSITISGTLGAAIEAASYDIPSMAISLQRPMNIPKSHVNYTNSGKISSKLIQQMLNNYFDTLLLNVNIAYAANLETPISEGKISKNRHYIPFINSENNKLFLDFERNKNTKKDNSDADIIMNKKGISITKLDHLIGNYYPL